MSEDLLQLWGKARPGGAGVPPFHPLLWHALDVAAVGEVLVERCPTVRERTAEALGLERDAVTRTLAFFLALHDLGKVSRLFQAMVPELWPERVVGGPPPASPTGARAHHTELGLDVVDRHLCDALDSVLLRWRRSARMLLLTPFLAHHGRPRAPADVAFEEAWGEAGRGAARRLVDLLRELFEPSPLRPPDRTVLARASWLLAGLTTLADWLGSAARWFPYERPDIEPRRYLEEVARPRAARAVREAGLLPSPASTVTGLEALVGHGFAASPIQRWAETVPLGEGPFLVLIEEVTGGGKTEAALVLAQRAMAAGRARGIYIGLPTMATADAMFERIGAIGRRLFAESAAPSLALAHARAHLLDGRGFRWLAIDDGRPLDEAEDERDQGRDEAVAWLGDDRRKAFLADLGVGTLDQALLAALPSSFQALRLLGLHERVLIVDEAHAYDDYTTRLLSGLLEFQASLGGSAIVLSATLPTATRRGLVAAFAKGLRTSLPEPSRREYPLVTRLDRRGLGEIPCAHRAELGRILHVERVGEVEAIRERIEAASRDGAAVVWIRNTVDDALAAYDALHERGIEAQLFHARFAMGNRLAIERAVLGRFGKGAPAERRRGVLVATQVVEQSLDLDFDLVISDLAPVDLLLQRAGRLWRHPGRQRPIAGPRLLVLSPEPNERPDREWVSGPLPGTAAVYRDHARLWLTARELFTRLRVRIPQDVRELVEAVYGETVEIPETLERDYFHSEGERRAAQALAGQNVLAVERGYLPDNGAWGSEVRTPTRLGEPMVTLRLSRFVESELRPWCEDPDPRRAWALSEVQVRAARLGSVDLPAGCSRDMVERVRRSWGRFEAERPDLQLAALVPGPDGRWEGRGRRDAVREVVLVYSGQRGLELVDPGRTRSDT